MRWKVESSPKAKAKSKVSRRHMMSFFILVILTLIIFFTVICGVILLDYVSIH